MRHLDEGYAGSICTILTTLSLKLCQNKLFSMAISKEHGKWKHSLGGKKNLQFAKLC